MKRPATTATATTATTATTTTSATTSTSAVRSDHNRSRPPASGTTQAPKALSLGDGLTMTVRSATYLPATTDRGRARQRGRISVLVTVSNHGSKAIKPDLMRVAVHPGGTTVHPDHNAIAAAGVLSRPLPAGKAVRAMLNFETIGSSTRAASKAVRVKVFTAGGSVAVKLD